VRDRLAWADKVYFPAIGDPIPSFSSASTVRFGGIVHNVMSIFLVVADKAQASRHAPA